MMKPANKKGLGALGLLLALGLLAPELGQAQPSFASTRQFWKDPEFINKFMASYEDRAHAEAHCMTLLDDAVDRESVEG